MPAEREQELAPLSSNGNWRELLGFWHLGLGPFSVDQLYIELPQTLERPKDLTS
jgi:hypothetical protein